eukprot:2829468-Lingulodinium_polyedra.AAC.1
MSASASSSGECLEVGHSGLVWLQKLQEQAWQLVHLPSRLSVPLPAGSYTMKQSGGFNFIVDQAGKKTWCSELLPASLHSQAGRYFLNIQGKEPAWVDVLRESTTT